MNLNIQRKLFAMGHKPVVRSVPSRPNWTRTKHKVKVMVPPDGGSMILSIYHTFEEDGDLVYFAFSWPYSYLVCGQGSRVMCAFDMHAPHTRNVQATCAC